jgi:glycosyltransferase involved in cell wall biosynthesis
MKIGLIICTYNRPEYLRPCFDSIRAALIPEDATVVLIDDASTDREAVELFHEFDLKHNRVNKMINEINSGLSFSMKRGYDYCFALGCDVVINLDNDAVVKPNFIEVLMELYSQYPGYIISGFNTLTRNILGEVRHPVIRQYEDHCTKDSIGSINMLIDREAYDKYILPSLIVGIENNHSCDYQACQMSMADGKFIIVSTPSVVQHIGLCSSMGHDEEPDRAEDFE